MSKYIVDVLPRHNRAECANCGSSRQDGRLYVDFGLQVDWYGIVYLCSLCLKDISKELGLFAEFQKQIDELKNQLDTALADKPKDLEEHQKIAHQLHVDLIESFDSVKALYVNLLTPEPDSSADSVVSVESDPEPEQSASNGTTEDKSGSVNAKPGTTKSNPSTGRKNLPSLADLAKS